MFHILYFTDIGVFLLFTFCFISLNSKMFRIVNGKYENLIYTISSFLQYKFAVVVMGRVEHISDEDQNIRVDLDIFKPHAIQGTNVTDLQVQIIFSDYFGFKFVDLSWRNFC